MGFLDFCYDIKARKLSHLFKRQQTIYDKKEIYTDKEMKKTNQD